MVLMPSAPGLIIDMADTAFACAQASTRFGVR
jgi:hypothetical protein